MNRVVQAIVATYCVAIPTYTCITAKNMSDDMKRIKNYDYMVCRIRNECIDGYSKYDYDDYEDEKMSKIRARMCAEYTIDYISANAAGMLLIVMAITLPKLVIPFTIAHWYLNWK